MGWIDNVVVGIVVVGGIFIFYRALKEPADLIFGHIGRGIKLLIEKIKELMDGAMDNRPEIITYG